jgi:hypothetical protein
MKDDFMLELLNIPINFLCRRTCKNDDDKYPIVMRIIYKGERREIFTGLYCGKKEWDSNTIVHSDWINIRTRLMEIWNLIQRKIFERLKYSGLVLTITN